MIEGLDVSHYQNRTPNLTGKDFLFIKATEGTTEDTRYPTHYANGRKAGVVVGAYHFGIGGDPVAQAAAFINVAKDADLVALDLESSPNRMTTAQAKLFINIVQRTGRKCGLYASESGFPSLGQDFNWVANWSRQPKIPWTFWQDGPDHGVDHDFFKGTREQLNELAGVVMPLTITKMKRFIGQVQVNGNGHYAIRVADRKPISLPDKTIKEAFYTGTLSVPLDKLPGDRSSVYGFGDTEAVMLSVDVIPIPANPVDCSAAIAEDRKKAHIVYE